MTTWNGKRYLYKIYDSTGNYITTWNDVSDYPQFTKYINSGLGEMNVYLSRSADNFGEGDDVEFNNQVKLLVFDKDTPWQGKQIYSGYISRYVPRREGKKDTLVVTFLGFFSEFERYMHEDGAGNTTLAYTTVSPVDILKDVLDKFTAAGGTPDYNGGSADDPLTSVTYTFNTNSVLDALKKVAEISPAGWYFFVDADNVVQYHNVSATADHTFKTGRDVSIIEPEKRIENITNRIYFVGGDTGGGVIFYKKYEAGGSIGSYGLYMKKVIDQKVVDTITSDEICNRILNSQSSPEIRTTLKIIDNNGFIDGRGYDIEDIEPGDTCRTLGFSKEDYTRWDEGVWDVDPWDYALTSVTATVTQIVKVSYTPWFIEIETSTRLPDIEKRVEDINRAMVDSLTKNNPVAPS